MDPTAAALDLLDCIERDDVEALMQQLRSLRAARVEIGRDALGLIERAIALDRWPLLRPLMVLAPSDRNDLLSGSWFGDFLVLCVRRCHASGQMRTLLELLALASRWPAFARDEDVVEQVAQAALNEFALDDPRIVAIARGAQTRHGAFLVRALRNGRIDLVAKLAGLHAIRQDFGAYRIDEVPLVVAADVGATAALRVLVAAGAKPNVALRGGGYPLHYAIGCSRVGDAERCELVHELLRLGAVPELRDVDGQDAYALAASRGDAQVSALLHENGLRYGPRQSREARALGVRDVRVLYDKADGLIYRIGQPDVPFLEGGDYDGIGPCSIEHFRNVFDKLRERRPQARIAWFEPFLARLERGREFPFAEFAQAAQGVELRRFDQASNWSRMVD